jgi:hypothetical protein
LSRINRPATELNPFLKGRPADGFGWQRWAREQSISPEVAHRCKTDPRTAKFLLVLLSTYSGPKGTAHPGQDALKRQMGCGERTLRRATDALESAGLLAVERKRRGLDRRTGKPRTNEYFLIHGGGATTMTDIDGTGHNDGWSGTGHDGTGDRPSKRQGPATDDSGTGHSMAGKRQKTNDSAERFSRTSAHARAGGENGNAPSRSIASADEVNAEQYDIYEPSLEGAATTMADLASVEPWERYDDDSIADVISGVDAGAKQFSEQDFIDLVVNVWAYERAHKNREAIIARADTAARALVELRAGGAA